MSTPYFTLSDFFENEDGNLELIDRSCRIVIVKDEPRHPGTYRVDFFDRSDDECLPCLVSVYRSKKSEAISTANELLEKYAYAF